MTPMNLNTTVADLVRERPSRSAVFESFGIDYCCGGKRPLAEACERKSLDPAAVLAAIEASDNRVPAESPESWENMTALTAHLEATHHAYLRETLPRLCYLTEKAAAAHGKTSPELVELRELVARFTSTMDLHLDREEMVLFPMLRDIEGASASGAASRTSAENAIGGLIEEHDDAGSDLGRIRELTGDFTAPEGACNTWRAMVDGLSELEKDTFRHVHLENNVLFPMATAARVEPSV